MSTKGTLETAPPTLAATNAPPSHGRWWAAVFVGLLVSLPLAWLLSYGALLPFFIGVFFFALFGIIIGAAMFRVASPGRPYGTVPVFIGTTLVVLTAWSLSMVKESRDFPNDLAKDAVRRVRDIGDRTAGEFKTFVEDSVRRLVREQYPPGGTLGYMRWSMMSAAFEKGAIEGVPFELRRNQARWAWAVRVVLSIGLLAFGVASQTFLLRTPAEEKTASTV